MGMTRRTAIGTLGATLALPVLGVGESAGELSYDVFWVDPKAPVNIDRSTRTFRTINQALLALRGWPRPVRIRVRDGVYIGHTEKGASGLAFEESPCHVYPENSGTANFPTIIESEHKWRAILVAPLGMGVEIGDDSGSVRTSWVRVEGFQIRGSGRGVRVRSSDFVSIADCWVHHSLSHGVYGEHSTQLNVEQCLVEFNGWNPHGVHGVYLSSVRGVNVRACIIRDNSGAQIKAKNGTDDLDIYANLIQSSRRAGSTDGAILLDGTDDVLLAYNSLVGPAMSVQFSGENTDTVRVNNLVATDENDQWPTGNDVRPVDWFDANFLWRPDHLYTLRAAISTAVVPGYQHLSLFWGDSNTWPADWELGVGAFPFVPSISDYEDARSLFGFVNNAYTTDTDLAPDFWVTPP